MIYKKQKSKLELQDIIESFWLIDGKKDKSIKKQKIIPDGYPELIFHYKDSFRANISGTWFLQDKSLIAGQIKNHFYLENTGETGIFGIKLKPWALKSVFNFDMNLVTNNVVGIKNTTLLTQVNPIEKIVFKESSFEEKIDDIEKWWVTTIKKASAKITKGQEATKLIIKRKGEISIQEVIDIIKISERGLERYFKSYIGVSPKFYSRIIRFSNIFHLVQTEDFNWSDISYLAGFYDQSHFIKNFKEFTGEDPSRYGFTQKNMANFFLRK